MLTSYITTVQGSDQNVNIATILIICTTHLIRISSVVPLLSFSGSRSNPRSHWSFVCHLAFSVCGPEESGHLIGFRASSGEEFCPQCGGGQVLKEKRPASRWVSRTLFPAETKEKVHFYLPTPTPYRVAVRHRWRLDGVYQIWGKSLGFSFSLFSESL